MLVVLGVLGLALAGPAVSAHADESKLSDPNAQGALGLCDRSGHQVTTGSVHDTPFVWRAVSSVAATSKYAVTGRTATLFAYQPRPSTPAAQWSGELISASSRYSNPSHPMAALTDGDEPLSDFLGDFPTQLDGLVQLRLYLGAPGQPTYSFTYPSTTLQISGNTWRVVDPVKVSCSSGTSESLETLLGVGGSAVPADSSASQSTAPAPTSSGSGTPRTSPIVIALAGLVVISAVVWFFIRDHRPSKGLVP